MTIENTLAVTSALHDHDGATTLSRASGADPRTTRFVSRSAAIPRLRDSTGRRRRLALIGADFVGVAAGLAIGVELFGTPSGVTSPGRAGFEMVGVGLVWITMLAAKRVYTARCVERIAEEITRIMIAGVCTVGLVIASFFVADAPLPTRSWAFGLFALTTMALLVERSIARQVFARLRASGRLVRRIAIVGTDDEANALARNLEHDRSLGYRVAGLIGPPRPDYEVDYPIIGALDRASEVMQARDCVGAVVSITSIDARRVNSITRELADHNFHVALSTNLRDIDVTRMRPQGHDGEVLIYVEPALRTGWRKHAKRSFDVVFSALALLLSLPVLAIAALLIKLDSPGPILFRQSRVGRDGRMFHMIKLRTMVADAEQRKRELVDLNEATGPMFKIREDPRVTRIGRFLRKSSLDEFPQFWNVLRGEMSIVGPRPALPTEVLEWDADLFKRLSVPPGITGIWQVSGRSGATFEQYRRLDLYYVDNWTLRHDLEVVARTFWAVLVARGAS